MQGRKGCVGIESDRGRLRLRLPRSICKGSDRYLYLELMDTEANRKIASHKAAQIERDLFFNEFDSTLEKYRSPRIQISRLVPVTTPEIEIRELWAAYSAFKAKFLSPSSMKDFRKTKNHIEAFPSQALKDSRTIINHLLTNLSPDSARRVLVQLNACCKWAIEEGLVAENPFEGKAGKLKVQKRKSINPFTQSERDLIVNAFESQAEHSHYAPFVKFLFLTGCRTSEAVGLLWRHIDPEVTSITFEEVVVDGQRIGSTKNHKTRKFPVNAPLLELMSSLAILYPERKPDKPIFTDKSGNLIRPNNFLRRHWEPVIRGLGINYRPQYNTRHSFITWCLEAKVPISQVAAWVGNSPEVILRHYAGLTRSEVPEL